MMRVGYLTADQFAEIIAPSINAVVSTSFQPLDGTLTALAGLSWAAGSQVPIFTAADTVSFRTVGAAAGTDILDRDSGDGRYLEATQLDTDTALAANSDALIASQKAVKTYVDSIIAAQDALVFKGVIDCSASPNYPAADRGHSYRVSVAGKIGGAAGPSVEVGDLLLCLTDATGAGDHATVGAQWGIIQTNLDGAVIGPASATDASVAGFDGASGKLIRELTAGEIRTAGGLGTIATADAGDYLPIGGGTLTGGLSGTTASFSSTINGLTLRTGGAAAAIGIGTSALGTGTGASNIAIGNLAGDALTTGNRNTLLGHNAMGAETSGADNTCIGMDTGTSQLGGQGNTYVGRLAGSTITSGDQNTIIGYNSTPGVTTGRYNTIVGGGVTGLAAATASNVILADGLGTIRFHWDGTYVRLNGPPLIETGLTNAVDDAAAAAAGIAVGGLYRNGSIVMIRVV